MLTIIGAGFGRTGTTSVKAALEFLGRGPCYHMDELFRHPAHAATWSAAADGRPVDWGALLAGYAATVDWPACAFWEPLAARYPAARVLLTVRDSGAWYDSLAGTILPGLRSAHTSGHAPDRRVHEAAQKIVLDLTFGGRVDDREGAIATYEAHNRRVIERVPAQRLLVYRVTDGWAPLCRFLGVPVPGAPFPRLNTRQEFQAQFSGPG